MLGDLASLLILDWHECHGEPTESEAGVKLPPGVGILTYNVVKTRPDLSDMLGFTVRVPRSLDIEANDGPQRVWVQGPNDGVEEVKPIAFPTIVLSAAELLTVYRGRVIHQALV